MKRIIISLIIAILLVGSMVMAMTYHERQIYDSMDSFWDKLRFGIKKGLFIFTSWGQENCCSENPDNYPGTWIAKDQTIKCTDYCSYNKCAFNIWYQSIADYPAVNYNNWYGEVTTGSFTNKFGLYYWVEVYCCPQTCSIDISHKTQVLVCDKSDGVFDYRGEFGKDQSCPYDTSGVGKCWCASEFDNFYVDSVGGVHCALGAPSSWCGCTSNYEKKCYFDDVWKFDSCGNPEEKYQECSYGCENGACKTAPSDGDDGIQPPQEGCGDVRVGSYCPLPKSSILKIEKDWDYVDDCTTGFCMNVVGIEGGKCSEPKCCENKGQYQIFDSQCDSPYTETDLSKCEIDENKLCSGNIQGISEKGITTLAEAKKISLTKDKISKSTSPALLASTCLKPSECIILPEDEEDYSAECISIAKLRDDGTLTESDSENFFSNSKTITKGTIYGASAGVTACYFAGALISGGVFMAPAAIGCSLVGGLLGGSATMAALDIFDNDDLLKELNAKNENVVGICTLESKSPLGDFIGQLAFFKITGDKTIDGLIILFGLIILIILILRR